MTFLKAEIIQISSIHRTDKLEYGLILKHLNFQIIMGKIKEP